MHCTIALSCVAHLRALLCAALRVAAAAKREIYGSHCDFRLSRCKCIHAGEPHIESTARS